MSAALIQLDGLIAGMEMNSEIPVQLSELKLLRQLLVAEHTSQAMRLAAARQGMEVIDVKLTPLDPKDLLGVPQMKAPWED